MSLTAPQNIREWTLLFSPALLAVFLSAGFQFAIRYNERVAPGAYADEMGNWSWLFGGIVCLCPATILCVAIGFFHGWKASSRMEKIRGCMAFSVWVAAVNLAVALPGFVAVSLVVR
ncbi:MAG: hypothetical protein K8R23_18465 [Chthoniobacter sp.]|nr:hypothetical protein [Chthoniobacter sp.]